MRGETCRIWRPGLVAAQASLRAVSRNTTCNTQQATCQHTSKPSILHDRSGHCCPHISGLLQYNDAEPLMGMTVAAAAAATQQCSDCTWRSNAFLTLPQSPLQGTRSPNCTNHTTPCRIMTVNTSFDLAWYGACPWNPLRHAT
jgi:hypothetical protein